MAEEERVFNAVCERFQEKIGAAQDICQLARKLFDQYKRKTVCPVKVRALAALYAALKATHCYPMNLREFLEMFEGPALKVGVTKVYKRMMMEAELKPQFCHVRPHMFVEKYAGALGFSKREGALAMRLANNVVERRLHMGKNPIVVAAAIVYIAALELKKEVTLREVAETARCSEQAVRSKCYFLARKLPDAVHVSTAELVPSKGEHQWQTVGRVERECGTWPFSRTEEYILERCAECGKYRWKDDRTLGWNYGWKPSRRVRFLLSTKSSYY